MFIKGGTNPYIFLLNNSITVAKLSKQLLLSTNSIQKVG